VDLLANRQETHLVPKVKLLPFDGSSPAAFQVFWETYYNTIDSKQIYSPIEKLTYLLSLLTGPAKEKFAGTPRTADMYDPIVDRLKRDYGDGEMLRTQILLEAHFYPICQNYQDVRKLVIKFEQTAQFCERTDLPVSSSQHTAHRIGQFQADTTSPT
jgi:hypothetical protein